MTAQLAESSTGTGKLLATPAEELAAVLADVLGVDRVPVDSHFFDDLGADSMVMTQFCARLRKRADLPSVSIKDVYQHPTVSSLAAAFPPDPAVGTPVPVPPPLVGLAAVLADLLHVDSVPVDSHFFDDLGADSMVMAQFCARVRKRDDLPTVSIKDVYQHPTVSSLAAAFPPVPAVRPPVAELAAVLADVLDVDSVPADGHFFDDLGADSMVMAQFCARVRKRDDLPAVAMKDVYQHPTISGLAAALVTPPRTPIEPAVPTTGEVPRTAAAEAPRPASTLEYVGCGVLQVLAFLVYTSVVAVVAMWGFDWMSEGVDLLDDYLRAVVFGAASFVGACIVPILAKWLLIGRWRTQEIRVWSLAYVRFWVVKTLIRTNPLVLFFVGSPIFVLYLRALGAKVGRDVVILAKTVPVCTDLLTIGDGTVIRKDTAIAGYRADGGVIRTGPVTLGRDVLVSEAAVLDIHTTMGDGSQLAHRSALYPGQTVPAGERWHGSPAVRTETDFRTVEPAPCGSLRRVLYSIVQVLHLLAVNLPLAIGGVVLLLVAFPEVGAILHPGPLVLTSGWFYLTALEISAVLFFGTMLVGLVFVVTAPRVLGLLIEPGRVYPLYGFHFSIQRTIVRLTNVKFFTGLLGDSSYIVPYLRALGYNLNEVVQTGSNFGTNVKHETPYLVSIGSGTMIADGLTIINTDFSNTSFRSSLVSIGPRNFLGNGIAYPAQGRTGDNCLLATKVMVPVHGPVREGVGLLGSPAFEIPRSVERDAMFDHLKSEQELGRHLAAKNRYNLRTIGLVLLIRWMYLFAVSWLVLVVGDLHHSLGASAVVAGSLTLFMFNVGYGFLVERTVMGWQWLEPQFCSIYDPYFWWHERYWKTLMGPTVFNGTPIKGAIWRLLGVRIGKRVFDDGCDIPERSLVTIGDGATLNAGSWLQCHSQEDGTFKSDHITVGAGATVGVGAWVHYGATIGDGAHLATDSFLMKGEEVPPNAYWGGNPAQEFQEATAVRPAPAARPEVTVHGARSSGRHRAPREPAVGRRLPAARNVTTTAELQHR